ncbi:DUF881 domain-containing protein [Antribacter gilvus]|uniref:DUF881 domain-containing protein n=1 Tax=Antribacter gilvus TaxID=2304675 RepID=UPI001F0C53F6|nr:DUF881 domain-containing protein [Antribacter gilvus]
MTTQWRVRPDASMTLLTEVMERPLDPGYAEAAARRAAAGVAGAGRVRRKQSLVVLFLLAAALGLVTATATRELRAPRTEIEAARELLAEQITARTAEAEALTLRSVTLGAEVDGLQQAVGVPPLVSERARLDRMVNGSAPVTGPGLVVSLTDGGGGLVDPAEADPDARVRDVDVQEVVNALWGAGAEAVAVNGQRLTALSAIRNAGEAILVDLQPLNGPTYVIEAVGNPEELQVEFARSSATPYLQMLGSRYGIKQSVITQSALRLPGAGARPLRAASAVGSSIPSPDAPAPASTAPSTMTTTSEPSATPSPTGAGQEEQG